MSDDVEQPTAEPKAAVDKSEQPAAEADQRAWRDRAIHSGGNQLSVRFRGQQHVVLPTSQTIAPAADAVRRPGADRAVEHRHRGRERAGLRRAVWGAGATRGRPAGA